MNKTEKLATRAGYGQGLLEVGALHDDLIVLEGDLGAATGSAVFGKTYPERYIEAGIAEQNEVGMASGLAAVGWVPFVTSFAIFTAARVISRGGDVTSTASNPPSSLAALTAPIEPLRLLRRRFTTVFSPISATWKKWT